MFERCLYFNLNELTRKINRIWDAAFAEFGLSPSHAYLLRLVLANPGLSQKDIAGELKLEKSTITRFINALVKQNLLVRNKSGRDTSILPTDEAKFLEIMLNNKGDELYKRMGEELGQDNLKRLVRALRHTSQKLS